MYKARPYLPTRSNPADSYKQCKLEELFVQFAKDAESIESAFDPPSDDEDIVVLSHRIKPVDVLMETIQKNEMADIIVTVEGHSFPCHAVILCIYSKVMAKLILELDAGEDNLVFDTPEMSPKGFSDTYQWMISTYGTLDYNNFIDILRTAYFLEIPELLEICWKNLDMHVFDEFSAFSILYQGRRAHELVEIIEKMSGRISRATLSIIASREFLSLSEVQVCCLLKSSYLAVNSEIELLYSALMWLFHHWPERQSSTVKVLKNIRYGYLSPTMLSKFKSLGRNKIGPFAEIFTKLIESPDLSQLVRDGLFYSSLVITFQNDPKCIENNIEFDDIKLDPRAWIQDHGCDYHRVVTRMCPNMRYISFKEFKSYLYSLREGGRDFDRLIKYPDDEKYGEEDPEWQERQFMNRIMLFSRINLDLNKYIKRVRSNTSETQMGKRKK
ncbi:kelch repeat and BTB domain-containing protein 12 [Drosophila takahashii]|uniref:kelch repeat and BTB domain-containing protein 12 n=1 Tax=Drosophila takahashii TaxID=29030 RepID=UPI003898E661